MAHLGIQHRFKKKKQQYDIDKICKYTGNMIFVLSGVLAITGVFTLIFSNSVVTVAIAGLIVFVAVAICGVIFLNTGNRVKKDGSAKA